MKSKSNSFLRFQPALSLLTFAAFSAAATAQADTYTWDGTTENWGTAHWTGAGSSWVDSSSNDAVINGGTVFAGSNAGSGGPGSITANSITVSNGTVALSSTNVFWHNVGTITLNPGGVLYSVYNATNHIDAAIVLNGGEIGGTDNGGLANQYGMYNFENTIHVTDNSTISVTGAGATLSQTGGTQFHVDSGKTLSVSGTLVYNGYQANTGLIKNGDGTMNLTNLNTYIGGTTVNAGTLGLGFAADGSGTGTIRETLAINSGATVKLNAVDALGWGGNSVTQINIVGGTLDNTVSGNNSYVTSYTLTGGTVSSTGGGQFHFTNGKGITTLASSNSSAFIAPITLREGNNMSISVADGAAATDLLISGAIGQVNGTGGITKSGDGTLTLSATNTYTGDTTVNGGTLELGAGGGAGLIRGTLNINNGATVNLTGTDALGYLSGSTVSQVNINGSTLNAATAGNNGLIANFSLTGGTVSGTGRMDFSSGYGITTLASGTSSVFSAPMMLRDNNNMTINVADGAAANDLVCLGVISEQFPGSGITKSGSGTMTLSGANTYTGATTVNGGTLALAYANQSISSSGGLTINNGSTVVLQNYNPMGSVSVTLPVTINSGGLMTMDAGWSVHLGPLTLNGGDLSSGGNSDPAYGSYYLDGDVTAKAGATSTISAVKIISGGVRTFDVESGGTLNVTGGFSNLYTGAFGLFKIGMGTMTLSAVNSYNGNTTVDDGTFELAAGGSLSFRPTTNGATNQISGSSTATLSYLGTVNLDLSGADATLGNAWAIVDLASFTGPAPTFNPALVTSTLGDFSEATPGVWELPVIGAKWVFIEATASLTYVSAATDYDTWKTANGVTGGENDDDDSDGLTNHEEYAFGLDPTGGSSVNPIAVQLDKATGTFSYTRRLQSHTGLAYTVWTSVDLATWTEDNGATTSQTVSGTVGEVETVQATITGTLPLTPPKLFIQVRAN
jgi:fibronectin-binding autotransporter adhesin